MHRIVLSDIDHTMRQQAVSLAIVVVAIRVNKAVPRDKGRASHSALVFVVGQYPPDLIRSGVGGCQFIVDCCRSRAQRLARSISRRRVYPPFSRTNFSPACGGLGAPPSTFRLSIFLPKSSNPSALLPKQIQPPPHP